MTPKPYLPLRAVPREELEVIGPRVIEDAKGRVIAFVGFDEDAEFIAMACNVHDQLVAASRDYLPVLNEHISRELSAGAVNMGEEIEKRNALADLLEKLEITQ